MKETINILDSMGDAELYGLVERSKERYDAIIGSEEMVRSLLEGTEVVYYGHYLKFKEEYLELLAYVQKRGIDISDLLATHYTFSQADVLDCIELFRQDMIASVEKQSRLYGSYIGHDEFSDEQGIMDPADTEGYQIRIKEINEFFDRIAAEYIQEYGENQYRI